MVTMNNIEIYLDTRTAAQWAQVTRVIPKGFVCVELGESASKIKIGDGASTYPQLPYIGGDMAEYYTKTEVDDAISTAITQIGNIFTLKGRVDNVESLPTENVNTGDVYLVGAESDTEFQEYYWTGTAWDYMGKTTSVDLSGYYTKTEVDELLAEYVKTNDKLVLNCTLGEV